MGKTPKLPVGIFLQSLPAGGGNHHHRGLAGVWVRHLKETRHGALSFLSRSYRIAVFGTLLLIAELREHVRFPLFQRGDLRIFVSMIAAFCLWILLMPLFGYLAMTLLATFGFCKIMKLEGWRKPLSISVGTTLFIYLMFDYWLYIDLPRGILG